jgi:hypothetical protein
MFSSFPQPVLGFLMLVLFGIFYYLSIFATVRAVLAFVGTLLIGFSGFIGGFLHSAVTWLVSLGGTASTWAFGVAASGAALTLIVGVIFVHDLMPKHSAGKRTGLAGIALAALLLAGASGIPALNGLPGTVQHAVTTVQSGG